MKIHMKYIVIICWTIICIAVGSKINLFVRASPSAELEIITKPIHDPCETLINTTKDYIRKCPSKEGDLFNIYYTPGETCKCNCIETGIVADGKVGIGA